MVFGDFAGDLLGGIVGGGAAFAVPMGTLFLLTILVVLLLSARVDISFALVIISPAVVVASVAGLLPASLFGVMVIVLGAFFALIVLSLSR